MGVHELEAAGTAYPLVQQKVFLYDLDEVGNNGIHTLNEPFTGSYIEHKSGSYSSFAMGIIDSS
jgi:hypothetical protein